MLNETETVLRLSRNTQIEIVRLARAALPGEAVGLIGGLPGGSDERVFPLPNIAGHGAFWADPYAQFQAVKKLRAERLELLAIYHSHPGGGAEPSASDIAWGSQWECAHLIIALPASFGVATNCVRLRAWRFGPAVAEYEPIVLVIDSKRFIESNLLLLPDLSE